MFLVITGVSVSSIMQTSTTSADGGTNVITAKLSDGTTSTFNIKNGSKGSAGTSISSVKQTTTATTDGGKNIVTVTLSDGTTSTFNVLNGTKGSTGDQGPKGDTPTLSDLGITATAAEINYIDGVTSSIQTQLNGKAASSHNHAASNITSGSLSSDRLPTVPITKGGTGATDVYNAVMNLLGNGGAIASPTYIHTMNGNGWGKGSGYTTPAQLKIAMGLGRHDLCNARSVINAKSSLTIDLADYASAVYLLSCRWGGLYRLDIFSGSITITQIVADGYVSIAANGTKLVITNNNTSYQAYCTFH